VDITKKYDTKGQAVSAQWELEVDNITTKNYTTFKIDRKTLWRIDQYEKVLDNALFYWWFRTNEIELRHTKPVLHELISLKDTCKIVLLRNAATNSFISKEVLDLYPPLIQQFLRGWSGEYKIKYGYDLPVTEPHDSGKDNDFL
jgi:hypothetical protein